MSPRAAGGTPLPEGVRPQHVEPLWARVDRNRVKLAFFITAYLASIVLSATAMAGIAALAVGVLFIRAPEPAGLYFSSVGGLVLLAAASSFVIGAAWVAYAMLRSEKWLLGRLGAVLTPTGEYMAAKMALKDMSIAAGFEHAPPLWVIRDCDRINAFALGRTRRGVVVGVTQGLVDRLDSDEQRAVFANLMARLCNGDVWWATAISALVGPIWKLKERDLRQGDEDPAGEAECATPQERARKDVDAAMGSVLYFVAYAFLIVITELLLMGHERSAMLTTEKADAEGMLLLKDPHEMLSTLEKVLEADNTVPSAGEAYSALFYCWAGFGYAPEDDPEFERIGRLREVLGVEGLIDPPDPRDFEAADGGQLPPAPRMEDRERPGR